ncbi:hypothetical protein [Thauera sp.]|uniref:hypothetical protein n=1 Tax=Thauera sp. TaxID=1905334 RepID=UPI001B579418|nr:hypothetical protein [Thauera sp.]MBP6132264.1 hypothetical protein [Thauera sp.]MBP7046188.1 hypothetical protein [Thauera sp.]
MRDFEKALCEWAQEYDEYEECPDAISIVFDGYSESDEEEGLEEALRKRCYAVFVHKQSATERFVFPEHDTIHRWILHRPDVEACFYVWLRADGQVEFITQLDNAADEAWAREVIMALWRKERGEDEEDSSVV